MSKKFEYFKNFIDKNNGFILTTHEQPDGDGIGSELALNSLLNRLGKKSIIINSDLTPSRYHFLDIDSEIHTLNDFKLDSNFLENNSLMIVDAGEVLRIGSLNKYFGDKIDNYFVIDHHKVKDEDCENSEKFLIVEDAAATGEIIFDLFRYYNITPNIKEAQAIYTSIVVDTGRFKYERTTSMTHDIASDLIKLGVNPTFIQEKVFENFSQGKILLMSKVLSTLKYVLNGKAAFFYMPHDFLKNANIDYSETDDFPNLPLQVKDVFVSVFFKDMGNDFIKVSLRSKSPVSVYKIAQKFNGGGHDRASGIKYKGSLDDIEKEILEQINCELKQFNLLHI